VFAWAFALASVLHGEANRGAAVLQTNTSSKVVDKASNTACRLDVIGKLVYNAACNPTDDNYKAVKTSNARISSLVMQEPGALDAMKAMGWQETEETLRCTKVPNMAQVRPHAAYARLRFFFLFQCWHCQWNLMWVVLAIARTTQILFCAVFWACVLRKMTRRSGLQFRDVEAAKNNLKKDLRTAEVAKLRKASGAAWSAWKQGFSEKPYLDILRCTAQLAVQRTLLGVLCVSCVGNAGFLPATLLECRWYPGFSLLCANICSAGAQGRLCTCVMLCCERNHIQCQSTKACML
jgi:hypothetical protein